MGRCRRIASWYAVVGYAAFMVSWSFAWFDERVSVQVFLRFGEIELSLPAFVAAASSVIVYAAVAVLVLRGVVGARWQRAAVAAGAGSLAMAGLLMAIHLSPGDTLAVGAFVGVGVALGMILWARYFSALELPRAASELSLGNLAGLAAYYLFSIAIVQVWVAGAAIVVSSVLSAFCLWKCMGRFGFAEASVEMPPPRASDYGHFLVEELPDIACLTATGVVWALLCPTLFAPAMESMKEVTTAAGIGASALVLGGALANRLSDSLTRLFRALFPFMLAGFVPLAISPALTVVSIFIVYTAVTLLSVVLVLASSRIARDCRLDPTVVFCVMFGIYTMLSGFRVHFANALEDSYGFMVLIALLMSCVYLLSFVLLWCYRRDAAHWRRRLASAGADMASEAKVPAGGDAAREHVLDRSVCCRQLAAAGHLTSREEEIVALIASGRSVNAIAERLCLSRNTVQTHYKNIYTKLGVHKKQQLLDMLEALAQPDADQLR